MKVNRLDHISIAVKDLRKAKIIWGPVLGKSQPDEEYEDVHEKIRVARYMTGEVGFELMESTDPDGEVAKFVERHGEGVMIVSLNVDNTRNGVDELKELGYPFVGNVRPFREGKYAFIHPKAVNGVLLELIDDKS